MPTLRRATTDQLSKREIEALGDLFQAAWSNKSAVFTDEDEEHAYGGLHLLIEEDGRILAHASVGARELHVGDLRLNTGYVEAVSTLPEHQGRGYASRIMRAMGEVLDQDFELGGLSTGIPGFYERFGWQIWQGPTYCRTDGCRVRTPEDDGCVLVRITPSSPPLDPSAPISCNMRSGDVW